MVRGDHVVENHAQGLIFEGRQSASTRLHHRERSRQQSGSPR